MTDDKKISLIEVVLDSLDTIEKMGGEIVQVRMLRNAAPDDVDLLTQHVDLMNKAKELYEETERQTERIKKSVDPSRESRRVQLRLKELADRLKPLEARTNSILEDETFIPENNRRN